MSDTMLLYIWLPFMIIVNGLWFWIKTILKDNGKKASYFYGHMDDIFKFNQLIKEEKDEVLKSKYKNIRNLLFSSLIFTMLSIFYLIFQSA